MNRLRKILIIEDEQDIARIIKDYISKNGYEVAIANNGKEALHFIELLNPEFIILDIMLPDVDGIELCRQIREKNNVPILILSARGSDTDKVLGLGFGADDYMTKPFSLTELLARIKSNLRRVESMISIPANLPDNEDILHFGKITIDKKGYKVTKDGIEISLSAKELELLFFLSKHRNQVFSKSQLLDAIWGYTSYGDESTITVYIRRIREKLEVDPSNPMYIKTVWGIGYKFSFDE
ncbi:response regulator transcription factor [Paenibacillus sp. IHBB 10380]|uniref:response regulator transcription factor n=1 Tax=Paenibacillus sp. IHBB 10380 TaxID=1566358 RepID=UPI0005CFDC52|nr:response regulator transcription factor [Paenibacillus sp. IHBB 10380]AJS57257.1 PhoP family transcriptional regulator [Paenibacillus sp. IHBB 10380]